VSIGGQFLTFQRIIVPSSSGSSIPRRIAMWQKSVSYIGMADVGSRWPEKVASQWGWCQELLTL
jgi:hypothetical protein